MGVSANPSFINGLEDSSVGRRFRDGLPNTLETALDSHRRARGARPPTGLGGKNFKLGRSYGIMLLIPHTIQSLIKDAGLLDSTYGLVGLHGRWSDGWVVSNGWWYTTRRGVLNGPLPQCRVDGRGAGPPAVLVSRYMPSSGNQASEMKNTLRDVVSLSTEISPRH